MPFTRPGPSQPPPCPPMQSRIPVRMGPNPRGHRPIMSYSRPDPPPQQPPFRYTMVPGMPRGLRPGYYIDPNESDPFSRMYNAQDLMDVEQQEEEIRQEQMRNPPPPRMVPGEGATGFTNLTGTDPSLPYGEQWSSSAWDEEAYAAPRQYLGNPFLSEPQIQEDNLGSRGRLRRMHPPSFYQQIAQNYPENPNLSMRELLNLHPGTRPWFRALGSAAFQGPRDKLKVQPGERASFFEEDICGTDPNNPYGTAYIAPDFEEYGVLNDDPDAFVIASDIPACPPNYDWETMEQVQNEMIEAAKAGVDFVKQNWNRAFQGQAPTWQSDDWGDTMMDTDIDEWTSATDFLEAEGTIGPQVVFEQQDEQEVRVQIPGDGGPRQVFGLDVIHEDCED